MNTFWILMEQIELFIVYLVIGMILVRTGVLSDKGPSRDETFAADDDLC